MSPRFDAALRVRVVLGAVAVLFVVLAVQTVRMQLLDPRLPPEFTDGAAPRLLQTDPPRGLITDRTGRLLAENVPEFRVALVPGELPVDARERRRALVQLESLLGVPFAELEAAATSHLAMVDPHRPVEVQAGLDSERAITLRAALAGKPYAVVESFAARTYESEGALAHILGYVGSIPPEEIESWVQAGYSYDGRIGLMGVEARYEPELRGKPGLRLVLSDPTGRELDVLGERPSEPGGDLVLSIDLELQRAVEEALARGMQAGMSAIRELGPHRPEPVPAGAAVVMDVRTGELLALVSLPTYDANLFNGDPDEAAIARLFTHPSRPLIDRTYMEVKPPGSIFKPVVAYAALEEGISHPGTLITSTGAMRIEDEYQPGSYYVIRDWAAHGTLDLYGAMARSSDIYFYYLAGGYREGGRQVFQGMGVRTLAEWTRAFGFGRPTGVDLPGEEAGVVPDPDWKEETLGEPWYLGETYTFGIGQSFLRVTPLQMAVATAAIANGGELLAPRVVRGVQRGDRLDMTPRRVTGTVPGGADTLSVVQRTMWTAAHAANGTARTGVPAGMTIAGKTGTAEFGIPYPNGEYDSHGWYIAYAPFDEPEIAVTVVLQYGVGATHAGPVVREILETYFHLQAERETEAPDPGERAVRP
jgi:penicillin-binding protein 2